MTERTTLTRFTPLPRPQTPEGDPRLCGVEIEFTGLTESETARLLARELGGKARCTDETDWEITGSELGKIEIYLDTALRKSGSRTVRVAGMELGREVIPVEIVTEPLDLAGLEALEALRGPMRREGAQGSSAHVFYGFGLHLNIQIASEDAAGITRPLLAYALIEDWMRRALPIDDSRKVLPFTAPYPTRLVADLARLGPDATPDRVQGTYLEHLQSRNFGLDMLPIFAWRDPQTVERALGPDHGTGARPAFHFRLPDCRIDDPRWSFADEWNRWLLVERIAEDTVLLQRLANAWLGSHGPITLSRQNWARRCGALLHESGLELPR